jgi:hypothetical protein
MHSGLACGRPGMMESFMRSAEYAARESVN